MSLVLLGQMGHCPVLSSFTGGSATSSMKFAEYQQVPADVQTKLLAEYAAQEQDED